MQMQPRRKSTVMYKCLLQMKILPCLRVGRFRDSTTHKICDSFNCSLFEQFYYETHFCPPCPHACSRSLATSWKPTHIRANTRDPCRRVHHHTHALLRTHIQPCSTRGWAAGAQPCQFPVVYHSRRALVTTKHTLAPSSFPALWLLIGTVAG